MIVTTKKDRCFYRGPHHYFIPKGTQINVKGELVTWGNGWIIDYDDFLKACGDNAIEFSN